MPYIHISSKHGGEAIECTCHVPDSYNDHTIAKIEISGTGFKLQQFVPPNLFQFGQDRADKENPEHDEAGKHSATYFLSWDLTSNLYDWGRMYQLNTAIETQCRITHLMHILPKFKAYDESLNSFFGSRDTDHAEEQFEKGAPNTINRSHLFIKYQAFSSGRGLLDHLLAISPTVLSINQQLKPFDVIQSTDFVVERPEHGNISTPMENIPSLEESEENDEQFDEFFLTDRPSSSKIHRIHLTPKSRDTRTAN